MKKIFLSLAVISSLSVNAFSDEISELRDAIKLLTEKVNDLEKKQSQVQTTSPDVKVLTNKVNKLEKKQKRTTKTLAKVKKQTSNDNIKWDIDFRTAYNGLKYGIKNGNDVTNSSVFTNRLWLGMASSPVDGLVFRGQIAAYSTWGGNNLSKNDPFQNVNWRESSKADDITFKLRQAYFIYTFNKDSDHAISISAGRRSASDGFLANHREGTKNPGSPLAHITNMEVDAAMIKVDNLFGLEGSYVKFVAGRSYDNINQPSYSGTPYTNLNTTDSSVNFFVMPVSVYNDGQYNLMAQYTYIDGFMGANTNEISALNPAGAITGAGNKHMGAISLEINGLNEDNDFLDDSIFFVSTAFTTSVPNSGYTMLGSSKSKTGYSFWTGFIIPDLMTDDGHIGFEYNYGSKYWAPMTWAEDTLSGSKIATRGNAYEMYWNLPIINKYFSAQLRYTYMDYKYKSNIEQFWADPTLENGDATSAQELRLFLRYTY